MSHEPLTYRDAVYGVEAAMLKQDTSRAVPWAGTGLSSQLWAVFLRRRRIIACAAGRDIIVRSLFSTAIAAVELLVSICAIAVALCQEHPCAEALTRSHTQRRTQRPATCAAVAIAERLSRLRHHSTLAGFSRHTAPQLEIEGATNGARESAKVDASGARSRSEDERWVAAETLWRVADALTLAAE